MCIKPGSYRCSSVNTCPALSRILYTYSVTTDKHSPICVGVASTCLELRSALPDLGMRLFGIALWKFRKRPLPLAINMQMNAHYVCIMLFQVVLSIENTLIKMIKVIHVIHVLKPVVKAKRVYLHVSV